MLWGDGPLGQSQSHGSDGEVHLSRMDAGKDGHGEAPICASLVPWLPCTERTNLLVSGSDLISKSCSD